MGLFGRSGSDEKTAVLEATRARLAVMPLDELADELLRGTFGPGAPGEGHLMPMPDILKPYDPTGSGHFAGMPHTSWMEVQWLIEEGLQRLEHQGLVVMGVAGSTHTYTSFRATRAGRARLGL